MSPPPRPLRWYRRLLKLYPASFREEYEHEMLAYVEDRRAGAPDRDTGLRFWAALLGDVLLTAPAEHLGMLRQDVTHAWRAARKTPVLTLCLLIVFAVGTGATTAVFTLTNAVLLRPLPFAEPERLVVLDESAPARKIPSMGTTFPNLLDYQRDTRTLSGIGAFFSGGFSLTGGGEPERVDGAYVSWNLFRVLGVQPFLGRNFLAEEDRPNVETAVILGYGLWQRRYGGALDILGRAVEVSGERRTVVGVMPRGFRFPEAGELWVPMSLDPAKNTRTDNFLTAIGRLAPGVSFAQASADMDAVLAQIARRFPNESGDLEINVLPLRDTLTGDYAAVLVRLLAAALFVLAIACANVTNLLLARAAARQRELAVRTTLGANRRRIVRQLTTETLVLGVAGGLAGVLVGAAVVPAILRAAPIDIPFWIRVEPDWRVLVFSVTVVGLAGLVAGLVPAARATRLDVTAALNDGGRGASAGRRANRLREGLVGVQLALSVVLLVGAGLMVRSFINVARVDLGFRPADTLTFRLALPQTRYPEQPARARFYQQAIEGLSELPGIEHAGAASSEPFGGQWWRTFLAEGETKTRLAELPSALNVVVTPGYFRAMGIRLDRGRDVTHADGPSAPVVIVNRTLAERHWPGQDPIGRRVRIDSFLPDSPWRTVIAVASDVRWTGPREEAPPTVYVPHAFEPSSTMSVFLRSPDPPPVLAREARALVRRLDPGLPLAAVRPVSELVTRATWNFRLYTQMFVAFAVIAVLLAAVGLGGIMTQMVVERTHEIGIRLAIGAAPKDIVSMVVRRAVLLALAGMAVGLAGALMLARTLAALLYGVTAQDAATLAVVLVLLAAVALLAALVPARKASRVDPLIALRAE